MLRGKEVRMKIQKTMRDGLLKLGMIIGLCLVVFIMWYSNYRSNKANAIILKSRYTFAVRIDEQGSVVEETADSETDSHNLSDSFGSLTIEEIGEIWLREFTGQFTQKYLSWSKALKKVRMNETKVLDAEKNTVLLSFSANLKDMSSEYFSSWNGVLDDGRLNCEWVVKFNIDDHHDGTATIYADSIVTPEDYGIAQYNESLKGNVAGETENTDGSGHNSLTGYEIKNGTLFVTFDGGEKYVTVPVDCDNLMMEVDSAARLREGSYMVSTTKTAFLYGGKVINGNRVPVTLIYSDDKGTNWVTCEIDQIYDADYFYVEFFDEKVGVIVVGYAKNDQQESSRIYATGDGGETWVTVGTGPATNIIKGVRFIDENIGFFCYDYVNGMDSNLYMTKDAGKTFSKIVFEAQELDSTAANSQTAGTENTGQESGAAGGDSPEDENGEGRLEWADVYKEALVPIYDSDGVLTVYLTQGKDGIYNSGKTAAKYQSMDKGNTWKYICQLEINMK